MDNKIIQDIKSGEKKTIRNVPIPNRNRSNGVTISSIPDKSPRQGVPRWILWGLVGLAVVVLIFATMSIFSGATVSITLKNQQVSVDNLFTAHQDAEDNTLLTFETIRLERVEEQKVEALGEEFVEKKASGNIVIFNNHDSNNQRLIKNTRFETPDGLIYRIRESVVVPGKDGENPGQLEVTVFADEPGERYNNIGLVDFTIPGFAGTERFDTFYAKSKTDMGDGYVGNIKTVSDGDREVAKSQMQSRLSAGLWEDLKSQTPENFLIFENGTNIKFETQAPQNDDDGLILREKGILSAIVFDNSDFSKHITGIDENSEIIIKNPDEVTFEIQGQNIFEDVSPESFTFSVSGNLNLVWNLEPESISKALSGSKKSNMKDILVSFPEIEKADSVITPFWKNSFPEDIDKIKVELVY